MLRDGTAIFLDRRRVMHSGTPASGTDASLLSVVIGVLVAVGYLTVGWAMVVRTGGTAVLGLRVLSTGRSRLGWARAFLRAVLCVIFPSACCGRR
jgi:hypothetical protein